MYLTQGLSESPPAMATRCGSLALTVPTSYAELEAKVKRWISTCVLSRTNAAHREVALVTNNASLQDLWNKVFKNAPGQQFKLLAEYVWGPNRVESIRFSIPTVNVSFEPDEIVVTPPLQSLDEFVRKAIDIVKRNKQLGIPLGADQARRIECVLRALVDPAFDDRFVNFYDLWAHANMITANDPKWNLILNNARDWMKLPRRSTSDERFILSSLRHMDESIWKGVQWLYQQYVNLGSAMSTGMVSIKDWVADRQQRPNNIYTCYH
jgi:hypothetical protein